MSLYTNTTFTVLEKPKEQLETELKLNVTDMAIQTDNKGTIFLHFVDFNNTLNFILECAVKFTQTDQIITSDEGSSLVILFIHTLFTLMLCLPFLGQDIVSIREYTLYHMHALTL